MTNHKIATQVSTNAIATALSLANLASPGVRLGIETEWLAVRVQDKLDRLVDPTNPFMEALNVELER